MFREYFECNKPKQKTEERDKLNLLGCNEGLVCHFLNQPICCSVYKLVQRYRSEFPKTKDDVLRLCVLLTTEKYSVFLTQRRKETRKRSHLRSWNQRKLLKQNSWLSKKSALDLIFDDLKINWLIIEEKYTILEYFECYKPKTEVRKEHTELLTLCTIYSGDRFTITECLQTNCECVREITRETTEEVEGGRLWQSEKRTADRSPTCQAQVRSLHRGGSRRRSASTASRAVAGCDQQQDDTQEFSCSGGISLASTRAKKKKKKRKSALLITFDFLLILCCWWWTGASSVLKPRCLHTAVISSWLFTLISFFSALGKHHVGKKNPSFSLFCLARFPQTNIRDTYSSWLQHPAGLTAPRAQSLPVVTKLGLFIIPPNKRRCGDVSAPRNEAQD